MPEEATIEEVDQEIAGEDTQELTGGDKVTEVSETQVIKESELIEAKSQKLADIIRREKEAESSGEPLNLTDEELDIYDEYIDGKLKPGKPKKTEEEDESEEKSKDKSKEEDKSDEKTPKEISELLKLTGAKDEKDLLKKVKGLTNNIANKSKDTEFVAKISSEHAQYKSENAKMAKQIESESQLWKDYQSGDRGALEYLEKTFGLVPKNKSKASSTGDAGDYVEGEIPREGFLDDETAKHVNGAFKSLKDTISKLEGKLESLEKDSKVSQMTAAKTIANEKLLNETYEIAKQFGQLKDLPNLKNHVHEFLSSRDPDPLFKETLGKVFDKVKEVRDRGGRVSFADALNIMKGEDSELLIREAESKGRKSAYQEHQPSNNLSEIQRGGESSTYIKYTDEQVQDFMDDPSTIPNELFDDDGEPLPKNRMSKKLWKVFGYK